MSFLNFTSHLAGHRVSLFAIGLEQGGHHRDPVGVGFTQVGALAQVGFEIEE